MADFIRIEIMYPIKKDMLINTSTIADISREDCKAIIHTNDNERFLVSNTYDELVDVLAINKTKSLNS